MIEIPPEADQRGGAGVDRRGSCVLWAARWPRYGSSRFEEGRSAQILHLGGPADEHRSVVALYDAVAREGLHPHGHLHEIRLADYERVPDGRARAILRLPIEA
jgi:hypothetical protein